MQVGHLLDQTLHHGRIGAAPLGQHGLVGRCGGRVLAAQAIALALQRLALAVGQQQGQQLETRIKPRVARPVDKVRVESLADDLDQHVRGRFPVGDEQHTEGESEGHALRASGRVAGAARSGAHARIRDQGAAEVAPGAYRQRRPVRGVGVRGVRAERGLREEEQVLASQKFQLGGKLDEVTVRQIFVNLFFSKLDLGASFGRPFGQPLTRLLILMPEQRVNVGDLLNVDDRVLRGRGALGSGENRRDGPGGQPVEIVQFGVLGLELGDGRIEQRHLRPGQGRGGQHRQRGVHQRMRKGLGVLQPRPLPKTQEGQDLVGEEKFQ